MKAAVKLAIVLISLVSLGFSTLITPSELVFADKKDSKKNQKIDNKLECDIDTDHNKDSIVGPNDQQCENNGINLIDSNFVQSPSGNGSGNGDFNSPTVVSVDPNDGQNDVSLNTEIKVVFSERMDQDTLDDGSLQIFNLDSGVEPNVNADPSSESVTYTLDRQLEPGTRYEAELDFDIQDANGNFLDCNDSNDVDSSCRWQFETTGSSNANIELSPASGPFGTTVRVTGTGFSPNDVVIITFGEQTAARITDNNGEFDADITVFQFTPGPLTVAADDGSNSDTATFTVTSAPPDIPAIAINPTFGPVGTSVNIRGINFDPINTVEITFNGTTVATTPSPVTTDSNGGFNANFTIPSSSTGSEDVVATQGSNSDSTIFTVTPSTSQQPNIAIKPTSGPVGTSVNVTGINFDPNSEVTITFGGTEVETTPSPLKTDSSGRFFANFPVPLASTTGLKTVTATEDERSNSDSTLFTITEPLTPLSTNQQQGTNSDESIATQGMLPF